MRQGRWLLELQVPFMGRGRWKPDLKRGRGQDNRLEGRPVYDGLHPVHSKQRRHPRRDPQRDSVKGSNRMLKKSVHGFFNDGLSEVNSATPHKLLDFSSLAIWQSIHVLP